MSNESRGWIVEWLESPEFNEFLTAGHWWSPKWGVGLLWFRFERRTEDHLFAHSGASELQLNDVLPAVSELRLEFGRTGNEMQRVFEAMNSSKPSKLEVLTATGAGPNDVGLEFNVERLAGAIASGGLLSLKRLALTDFKIGDGHPALARAMASGGMPALESLDLSLTWLWDDHCLEYENALKNLPSLTEIRFAHNPLGKLGAQSLGRAIGSGRLKNLAVLDLGSTIINDDDMTTLAGAFQEGEASLLPNLESLIFFGTRLKEVGMLTLSKALISGRLDSLKELDMRACSLGSEEDANANANALVSALYGNNCLTVDIKFEWYMFPDLDRRRKQLTQRNSANVDILAGLSESPVVPAKFGKVYLCGNPEVGKTTLRRTLQRSSWRAMLTWETRPRVEKRTRGIQVSQIISKSSQLGENPITLRVWDMAGQEDYHLVHNAFFPALNFAEGRATIFVIVCKPHENPNRSVQELNYWLRYIASSCDRTSQDNPIQYFRRVLVVLNNIGGHRRAPSYAEEWTKVLEDRKEAFSGYVHIQIHDFFVDVRKKRLVKGLERYLSQYSRDSLNNQNVPAICQLIQEEILGWSNATKQFPVLHWERFVEKVNDITNPWPMESVIEAAAKYLNEAGILIYIDKKFPPELKISSRKLVVLDPNWFCNEIVGLIFLTEDMLKKKEHLFRAEVDERTGSISISDVKAFFQSMHGKWSDSESDDLIDILLWLGVCYKGRDQNVFIPALISEYGIPGMPWSPDNLPSHEGNQWVMGFSIEHEKNDLTLAPISLWHRFQVEIAQSTRFNGELDHNFVTDRYFMTLNVDFMSVLIVCQNSLFKLSRNDLYKQTESSTRAQQDPAPAAGSTTEVEWGSPTFDEINIFVMPLKKKDDMDETQRKQLQVDLASDLVEILLGLWNAVCPGVKYVHRVAWPWPVSRPGPEFKRERNLKVTEVQKWVQEHGLAQMQLEVGSDNWIRGYQLLSKKEKGYVVDSVQDNLNVNLNVLRQGMREAVELRIFPPDVLREEASSDYQMGSTSQSDGNEAASQPLSPTGKLVLGLASDVRRLEMKVDKMDRKLEEGFKMVMTQQKELLHKLQDTEEIFHQDKERTCPNHIYLGKKTTEGVWAWATLKEAFSVRVRLHFACEAQFDNCRPHTVKDQQAGSVRVEGLGKNHHAMVESVADSSLHIRKSCSEFCVTWCGVGTAWICRLATMEFAIRGNFRGHRLFNRRTR